jgi:1-acyl-sn-glycerol-3-phosphate acyltransferase
MVRIFCKLFVRFLITIFYHHKTYGKEHIPKGGAMVVANHCSFLDPPIIGVSLPGKIYFLARETLFKFPPFAWLLRQLCTHPVSAGKGNIGTFKTALELVEGGKKVVIFPEGKRSRDGTLHKGQLGVGMLVQRARCRVIPVYVHGTYEAWSADRKFPKFFGRTACVIGAPIEYVDRDITD